MSEKAIGTSVPRMLVLGAAGMLGNAVFRFFSADAEYETFGTLRSNAKRNHFAQHLQDRLLSNVNVESENDLLRVFADIRPNIVINCVGIIKQLSEASDHLTALSINATFPHRLANICSLANARLVHLSTDCVFSGRKGLYVEQDFPDADDLYGRTKFLGEVSYPHAVTLRTSIIGHELGSSNSLIDWFLSQKQSVFGYRKAIFSGLPTIEIARVIRDFVLPQPDMSGLYHLSADPISKFDILTLVAKIYGKQIKIEPSDTVVIDRSLTSNRFKAATGYQPPAWEELINQLYNHHEKNKGN